MVPRALWIVLLAAVVGLATVATCASSDDERAAAEADRRVTRLPEAEDAVDAPLMHALLQAKNLHRKARVYMTDGNLAEAIAAVEGILAVEFPADSPEGEDVRLDAHALLGKLRLAQGDLAAASRVVAAGIAAATRDSFFLANLHTVRGEVLEAEAARHDEDGRADEARATRRTAIEAYDASIRINETLQRRLLAPPGAGR
jgi:tetratricopeptide (TPR) repeat protein